MPRIRKSLPPNRADYSFGDLVYWHLFVFGTRPNIDPAAKVGRVWRVDAICTLLGKTDRTLRNWINDKSLPDDVSDLCLNLFGNNPAWDEARLELQESLSRARAARQPQASAPSASANSDPLPPDATDPEPDPAEEAEAAMTGSDPPSDDKEDSEEKAEEEVTRPPNAAGSREIVHVRPIRLRAVNDNPGDQGGKRYRRAVASLVAGICLFFGFYAWLSTSRQPRAPEPKVAAVPEPKRVLAPPMPAAPVEVQPEQTRPAPPPAVQERPKEAAPKIEPPVPTEEERKRAEEDRLEKAHMEARRQAYEREKQAREAEALRLDQETDNRARELAGRDNDARMAAGMGYSIQEHRRVAGSSYAHVLAATVGDCAVACTRDSSCDAFGYYREQYGPESKRRRVCYLFKKPFEVSNYPGYVHGELIKPRREAGVGETAGDDDKLLIRVQAKKDEPKAGDDGLTRCATGPVKVTGFKLTCDQTLGGGTTLGSTRLSYTVANINECAAKCRPVQKCVGFTFNAGDREGQHSCIIFGPTPEARDSKGWVSGVR